MACPYGHRPPARSILHPRGDRLNCREQTSRKCCPSGPDPERAVSEWRRVSPASHCPRILDPIRIGERTLLIPGCCPRLVSCALAGHKTLSLSLARRRRLLISGIGASSQNSGDFERACWRCAYAPRAPRSFLTPKRFAEGRFPRVASHLRRRPDSGA